MGDAMSYKEIYAVCAQEARSGIPREESKAWADKELLRTEKQYAATTKFKNIRVRRKAILYGVELMTLLRDMYGIDGIEAAIVIQRENKGGWRCPCTMARNFFAQIAKEKGIDMEAISGFLGRTRAALFHHKKTFDDPDIIRTNLHKWFVEQGVRES